MTIDPKQYLDLFPEITRRHLRKLGAAPAEPGDSVAVAYCRVSTEDQGREGLSLEAQLAQIERVAEREGLRLLEPCVDDVSGKIHPADRPGFKLALRYLMAGDAHCLMVYCFNRLTRSRKHTEMLLDDFQRRPEWRLISCSEHLDTGTSAGRAMIAQLASWAQVQRESIVDATTSALGYRLANKIRWTRKAPMGWCWKGERPFEEIDRKTGQVRTVMRGGVPEMVPAEQELLARMLNLRRDGRGWGTIAKLMGTNPRTGNPFTPGNVAGILRHYIAREFRKETWGTPTGKMQRVIRSAARMGSPLTEQPPKVA